jgi:hypothetical protein
MLFRVCLDPGDHGSYAGLSKEINAETSQAATQAIVYGGKQSKFVWAVFLWEMLQASCAY